MKTIKRYYGQPILETTKGISAGKKVDFGLYRDRNPDSGWGQMIQVNLNTDKGIDEVRLNRANKLMLLQDLAYAFGSNTEKFTNKLLEFELV